MVLMDPSPHSLNRPTGYCFLVPPPSQRLEQDGRHPEWLCPRRQSSPVLEPTVTAALGATAAASTRMLPAQAHGLPPSAAAETSAASATIAAATVTTARCSDRVLCITFWIELHSCSSSLRQLVAQQQDAVHSLPHLAAKAHLNGSVFLAIVGRPRWRC